MHCPACGAPGLVRDTRDVPVTYKGQTMTIYAAYADYCDACGESIPRAEDGERVSKLMLEFIAKVNIDAEGNDK